jgi:hypothetical protein
MCCRSATAEEIRTFRFKDYPTDKLAECAGLVGDHTGPSEVDVDEWEYDEFWGKNGVADWRAITDEQLAAVQAKYGY